MKKLKVKKDAECMACFQCVIACSEAYYKAFDPGKSVIQIVEKKGKIKPMVCPQCGKCAEACEQQAIKQNAKGVYTVDKKLCNGCGKCVEACPFGLMVKAEEKPTSSKCIACGICVKSCPMEVLEIVTD
ncbi:Fe-S-cluster-containing hydrogenase component 2 [Acetitomaculum ruminis DSM 5522]|uniref:Fe-S-cluster-containing hydrogenase component 2 n=1 Tax=Acetitomaculum ruminis DSM 5522 TaxID=1120918 RepID=A0A1I0ZPL7_9FIRM|nr:4Fe-4S dicluster domain-containing protein [Acetitomaculum ruminis]SFB26318.1 Fe-S-cluster-containing hydrogenase component 2 [Acetitomaculum ruminis DSM 5522]